MFLLAGHDGGVTQVSIEVLKQVARNSLGLFFLFVVRLLLLPKMVQIVD